MTFFGFAIPLVSRRYHHRQMLAMQAKLDAAENVNAQLVLREAHYRVLESRLAAMGKSMKKTIKQQGLSATANRGR